MYVFRRLKERRDEARNRITGVPPVRMAWQSKSCDPAKSTRPYATDARDTRSRRRIPWKEQSRIGRWQPPNSAVRPGSLTTTSTNPRVGD